MAVVHEFVELVEVHVPMFDKFGYIWYMIDYGPQSDTLYAIVLKDSGEVWQLPHKDFRISKNVSYGISV
jgi:hypothetical protein